MLAVYEELVWTLPAAVISQKVDAPAEFGPSRDSLLLRDLVQHLRSRDFLGYRCFTAAIRVVNLFEIY